MIDADGWLTSPLFLRVDGVPGKVYTEPNSGANGLACHSVVGEEADFLDGVPNRFLDESKNADGSYTANAAASCMFILRKRRPHVQMYPVDASTWTSGGRVANTTTWAMEAEGGAIGNEREPLTEHQIDGFLAIAAAWEWKFGRELVVGQTVWAHWQLAQKYGYAATACESGRYAFAWARPGERSNEVTRQEFDALAARIDALELATFSGSEETKDGQLLPLAERQTNARYRISTVAEGKAQSIAQRAAQVPKHGHRAATTTVTVGDPVT